MVDSILAKFELSPETPAVHYANAAIAFQHKNEKEAKDWMATAEKNFSPQLNKLFAESLYEVGWLQKPAGQTRAALRLDDRGRARGKDRKRSRARASNRRSRRFSSATSTTRANMSKRPTRPIRISRRLLNLRGEILMEQKDFDGAEAHSRRRQDRSEIPRSAIQSRANPIQEKDYAKARERFEALVQANTGRR